MFWLLTDDDITISNCDTFLLVPGPKDYLVIRFTSKGYDLLFIETAKAC